ncbi:DUF1738 domain-containing protein [Aggregatibacter actinomycetemcomitans]|uniref:ArdC family protein n=1 Tax=Aggregatibacter actinomycetemcomitans TaxID=714 RepID=UPI0011D496C7|nr:ArdC-like ssDNA-binding domain-containing protein [Aggregatibacter actinomycetemcomitans]TYA23454.1 DUF1738 domain-containing protein [Aggregatibacter actinomycetemcomitans]
MKKHTQPKDLYQQITDQIVTALKEGTLPWFLPWDDADRPIMFLPRNGETGRFYSGINVLILWLSAMRKKFIQRKWVTFQGATHLGGRVRSGEKSTVIIFYKSSEVEEKDDNGNVIYENGAPKMKTSVFVRGHHVFNIEQCDGLEAHYEDFSLPEPELYSILRPELDELPYKMAVQLYHRKEGKACYIPKRDCIIMPKRELFHTSCGYYATLLHECGHATGHQSRLNREAMTNADFSTQENYAFEELIAELTSAFMCAHMGISNISQNAAYICHNFILAQNLTFLTFIRNVPSSIPVITSRIRKINSLSFTRSSSLEKLK